MKKLLLIIILCMFSYNAYAVDTKLTALDAITPDSADMLYCVDDVVGTPVSKSCLVSTLLIDANIPDDITIDLATTVTTNANLTGEVTSVGNAATIADSVTVDGWVLGDSTATTINKVAITAPATSATLTIEDGFTLTVDGDATVQGTNTGDEGFSFRLNPQQAKLPSTNPMGIDAGEDEWRGLFDDTTDECGIWCTELTPYNGGTLKAEFLYTLQTTSTTDTVEIELSIKCVSATDDLDSATYGTVDALSSGSVSTTAGILVQLSDASLNGDSCVEDDLICVQLCRDASVSTDADDVEMRGAVIHE